MASSQPACTKRINRQHICNIYTATKADWTASSKPAYTKAPTDSIFAQSLQLQREAEWPAPSLHVERGACAAQKTMCDCMCVYVRVPLCVYLHVRVRAHTCTSIDKGALRGFKKWYPVPRGI
eukprot:1159192-Pelagomonas_calceolata.AAC.6